MRYLKSANRRPGAAMLESALVLPIVIAFIMLLLVLALAAFRYQQIATMAREGARYASVRGSEYGKIPGNTAATPADVYTNGILPLAVGLDVNSLTYSVTWPKGNAAEYADTNPNAVPPSQPVASYVVVTVNYTWVSVPFFNQNINLTSTATMPMHY